jgi:hypothetical protein
MDNCCKKGQPYSGLALKNIVSKTIPNIECLQKIALFKLKIKYLLLLALPRRREYSDFQSAGPRLHGVADNMREDTLVFYNL